MDANVLTTTQSSEYALNNVKYGINCQRTFVFFSVSFFIFSIGYLSTFTNYSIGILFFDLTTYFIKSMLIIGGSTFCIHLIPLLVKLRRERPDDSPFLFSYRILRDNIFSKENRWRFLFAITGFSLVMSAFIALKVSIPVVNPFAYDQSFEYWDRVLHFGYQPWALLQPILGHEYVTLVIHRLYYFWFPVIFVTFFWQAATFKDTRLRLQFITSFAMCWAIIGGLMATLLSSAGPIYFDRLVLDVQSPYQEAMNYLLGIHNNTFPMHMIEIKEKLWENYINPDNKVLLRGISAMPSMHVSIAFLLVLFGWRKGPLIGAAYTAFFIVIFLGSIHLLWHYAIDGYVSILATSLIWFVCGKITRSEADHEIHSNSVA